MLQPLLAGGNISGDLAGSSVLGEIVWQGGNGWLVVPSFSQIAGAPALNVTINPSISTLLPGITNPISSPGVYPFYAPKGVSIFCEVAVAPGEQVSFSNIHFLGDE